MFQTRTGEEEGGGECVIVVENHRIPPRVACETKHQSSADLIRRTLEPGSQYVLLIGREMASNLQICAICARGGKKERTVRCG